MAGLICLMKFVTMPIVPVLSAKSCRTTSRRSRAIDRNRADLGLAGELSPPAVIGKLIPKAVEDPLKIAQER